MSAPEMDATDRAQQDAIERLQGNQTIMFGILVLNAAASVAQILEAWKVWTRGGP